MDKKLSTEALNLILCDEFNDLLLELTSLLADKWDRMTTEEKQGVQLSALVKLIAKDKASLITKLLLQVQQKTNANTAEL